MKTIPTKTDTKVTDWLITDRIVRLREWGTVDRIYELPSDATEQTIGSRRPSKIIIEDPSGKTSRVHARLVRTDERLVLHDLQSKNGVRIDGAQKETIELEPGVEIRIGGVILIAESTRMIELRNYLARLIGLSEGRAVAIDQALRLVRDAARHRGPLVLGGTGDLTFAARGIHRRVLGQDRPFVVVNPRRGKRKATVRAAESDALGVPAIAAAVGGTVCLLGARMPRDFRDALSALKDPRSTFQLVVCAPERRVAKTLSQPISIPDLTDREPEINYIINEFADDAIKELGVNKAGFTRADREWVREHGTDSLAEIETATLRLVAIRETRSFAQAAALLGMAPVSLRQWVGRRRLPVQVTS